MLGAHTKNTAALTTTLLALHVLRDVLSLVDDSLAKKLGVAAAPLLLQQERHSSAKKRARQRLIAQADQSI